MKGTKEISFEKAIEESLVASGGYTRGFPTHYDPALALDTSELMVFIGATQGEAWEDLVRRYGGDADQAQRRFYDRLARQIDERGTIDGSGTASTISACTSAWRTSGRPPASTPTWRPSTPRTGSR